MKNKLTNMKRKNAGFTLLELVVVVAVMGLISSMAMDVYTDNSNQKRFEATKERLAEIKFAIIGDPMMRVGSQAITKGAFFKDMERPPTNLNQLIIDPLIYGLCEDISGTPIPLDKKSDCIATSTSTNTWESYWKGPYLHNLQTFVDEKGTEDESDDESHLVFRDAWGNSEIWGSSGIDLSNFGWDFFKDLKGNITITSAGLNRSSGGTDYERDDYKTIYKTEMENITTRPLGGYCLEIDNTSPSNPIYSIDKHKELTECIAPNKWAAFKT